MTQKHETPPDFSSGGMTERAAGREAELIHNSAHVNPQFPGAAAMLQIEPVLGEHYNNRDLDELARGFANGLLSHARVRAQEQGI